MIPTPPLIEIQGSNTNGSTSPLAKRERIVASRDGRQKRFRLANRPFDARGHAVARPRGVCPTRQGDARANGADEETLGCFEAFGYSSTQGRPYEQKSDAQLDHLALRAARCPGARRYARSRRFACISRPVDAASRNDCFGCHGRPVLAAVSLSESCGHDDARWPGQ